MAKSDATYLARDSKKLLVLITINNIDVSK
jgi:hypothetical protein